MKTKKYTLNDVKVGNQVLFTRKGINDFRMYWTIIDFYNDMIKIKIADMGYNDELYINAEDIDTIQNTIDIRYIK